MNEFLQLVEDLKKRAETDRELQALMESIDSALRNSGDPKAEKGFRLPYSSNPKWIDERWK